MKITNRETEKQSLNLEKLTAQPSTQDYVNSIYSTLRMDTADFRNMLCQTGNRLMKIDQTMKRVTCIVERQAARK